MSDVVMMISAIAEEASHVITAPRNSCNLAYSVIIVDATVVEMPPTVGSNV